MNKKYQSLRSNIRLLGKLLGETISETSGEDLFLLVEKIRTLSRRSQLNDANAHQELLQLIQRLSDDEMLQVARAFNQFLNLANTADQFYGISSRGEAMNNPESISELINKLKPLADKQQIINTVDKLSIELVLTAHPTEINRRTLIRNSIAIIQVLSELDNDGLAEYEKNSLLRRLRQLIAQSWYTDEIRQQRPTPIDEAKWGLGVIENSLWEGLPNFLRELNEQLDISLNYELPIQSSPIKFTSWMGGDRDGNPNVTAKVTQQVLLLLRHKAIELYLKDIQVLIDELSMTHCTSPVIEYSINKESREPYRTILRELRQKLQKTAYYISAKLDGLTPLPSQDLIFDEQQLWMPLYLCYQSLISCKMKLIANGPLLDTLRRVRCFGLQLMQLDIRQDSHLHTHTLDNLTHHLGLGSYSNWHETTRIQFLTHYLNQPEFSFNQWHPDNMSQEVIETCRVIAQSAPKSIAAYVISMSTLPSDILAVSFLLKLVGNRHITPIVPLFETLNDLNNANEIMECLYQIPWYREYIKNNQMVMIGYSDSAKDAGTLAASWAQYKAQELLIATAQQYQINLTLFHGRGGTIGRGGAPAHAALLSQPPGSLLSGLRVTEQGEMIRFKLGLPQLTVGSLTLYTTAILEANLMAPPQPEQSWREIMEEMAQRSCIIYRNIVQNNTDFIGYFQSATPERELERLPLGSRPAKRNIKGGIENLRAIPWSFAWTQNRLMLPTWLGTGEALQGIIDSGRTEILKQMRKNWPFFATRIGMLEMVFKKTDLEISKYYEQRLVPQPYLYLGEKIRQRLEHNIAIILELSHDYPIRYQELMADLPWIAESVSIRNTYISPLNLLQVELLTRLRQTTQPLPLQPTIEEALMVTISGIAAGMRNTG